MLLHYIGANLANKFQILFDGTTLDVLLEQLTGFWRKQSFGQIEDVKYGNKSVTFKVYDCFECSHLPNIGVPVCKFDEGFLTNFFLIKLGQMVSVKELECYATGSEYCSFEIKILGPIQKPPVLGEFPIIRNY